MAGGPACPADRAEPRESEAQSALGESQLRPMRELRACPAGEGCDHSSLLAQCSSELKRGPVPAEARTRTGDGSPPHPVWETTTLVHAGSGGSKPFRHGVTLPVSRPHILAEPKWSGLLTSSLC